LVAADDVIDAKSARHVHGPIGRTVIYDEDLDLVDARNAARDLDQRLREGFLLVQAWNLDDQLQPRTPRRGCLLRSWREIFIELVNPPLIFAAAASHRN